MSPSSKGQDNRTEHDYSFSLSPLAGEGRGEGQRLSPRRSICSKDSDSWRFRESEQLIAEASMRGKALPLTPPERGEGGMSAVLTCDSPTLRGGWTVYQNTKSVAWSCALRTPLTVSTVIALMVITALPPTSAMNGCSVVKLSPKPFKSITSVPPPPWRANPVMESRP